MSGKKKNYKHCDVLVAQNDFDIETEDGQQIHVKKGAQGIVGFNDCLYYIGEHFFEEIDKDEADIDGISARGLAQYIATYLDSNLGLEKLFEDKKIDIDMFVEYIVGALVDLGLKDDLVP